MSPMSFEKAERTLTTERIIGRLFRQFPHGTNRDRHAAYCQVLRDVHVVALGNAVFDLCHVWDKPSPPSCSIILDRAGPYIAAVESRKMQLAQNRIPEECGGLEEEIPF